MLNGNTQTQTGEAATLTASYWYRKAYAGQSRDTSEPICTFALARAQFYDRLSGDIGKNYDRYHAGYGVWRNAGYTFDAFCMVHHFINEPV